MSARLKLGDVARWTRGDLLAGSRELMCRGVTTDSRRVEAGQVFVAIRGPQHDGHAFLPDVVAEGAGAVVVERGAELPPLGRCGAVAVDDTTRALGEMATGHRAPFSGPVVGITGSNGKTTTKEMCAAILGVRAPCLKNEGNFNNLYGLPLTLLRREETHRALVVELGTNQPGEIAILAEIARPTVGVITNVGIAHAERLGSREGIAIEKGALFEALPPDGVAVANAEDPRVRAQLERTRARAILFGRGADAHVRPRGVTCLRPEGFAFELQTPQGNVGIRVRGLGEATVMNALAASAAALAAGANLDDVAVGIERYRPVAGRLQPLRLAWEVVVLDDTYNANPQSMEVALRSLCELKGPERGLAVLGDMGELGACASEAHRHAGRLAAELGVDLLFACGEHAGEVIEGAVAAGMDPGRAHADTNCEELAKQLQGALRSRDWVLVKGSRSMHMERFVEALRAEAAAR